jgi:hypothetical protein
MSRIMRFLCVALGLTAMLVLLPAVPAHADFNAVCYITASGLPTIRMQSDVNGGVTFFVETVNGDGRFFQMRPAGGHWEIHSMHSLPDGSGLDLDANGYPVVIQD